MFESEFLGFHLFTFTPSESKLPARAKLPSESRELVAFPRPGQFFFVLNYHKKVEDVIFSRAPRLSKYSREEEGKQ
ncbi:MAG: hypothetical protein JWM20_896 [Patescibacteria group bacterium]|nr:hypothetical protein [Patescibacteria group bacterium]